jgi:hypothetical protein
MKSIILSFTTLVLSAAAAFGQATPADYMHETGIYGGLGAFTNPRSTSYRGERNIIPYTFSANYYFNFNERFQVGIDFATTRWKTEGQIQYPGLQNKPGFNEKTTYILADYAHSLTARANYVIPMYDNYRINRSNVYMGVAAGAVFTVNDGRTTYGQFAGRTGEEYRYMEQYNYEAGTGYTVGVQVGINYYFSNHMGFNLEAAPRYVHVSNQNHNIGSINGNFDMFTFPATIGLKFRF